jgi:hypothetical protein
VYTTIEIGLQGIKVGCMSCNRKGLEERLFGVRLERPTERKATASKETAEQ